jgi:hypothetical protein
MNPQTPSLHELVKLHKTPISVRPIINRCNSPAYKLAIYLTQILKENTQLPSRYNITNTLHLITNLQNLNINEDTRMYSFNISKGTNMPSGSLLTQRSSLKKLIQNNPIYQWWLVAFLCGGASHYI